MAIRFHILTANGVLTGPVRERLHAALAEATVLCSERLCLDDVDVVVMNAPHNVIPRIGVNGYAFDANQIQLSLDIGHRHLKSHFASAIRSLLAHELHHAARAFARGDSHGDTYGGSLVAEGLACCFEEEIGEPTPFYAVECKGEALKRFSERAKRHLGAKRGELPGSWGDWMFGRASDDPRFPYQSGYSTGYAIVRSWLDATGHSASSAACVSEIEILDAWLTGFINPFA
jgi:hypothetical protein